MNIGFLRSELIGARVKREDFATCLVLAYGPCSTAQLAQMLRVSTRTVQRSLGRLVKRGLVYRSKEALGADKTSAEWSLAPALLFPAGDAVAPAAGPDPCSSGLATEMTGSDRSGSISYHDLSEKDPDQEIANHGCETLGSEIDSLIRRVVDRLCLFESFTFIREELRQVLGEGCPWGVIEGAIENVKPRIWAPDGTRKHKPDGSLEVRHPAKYFVTSVKRAYAEYRCARGNESLHAEPHSGQEWDKPRDLAVEADMAPEGPIADICPAGRAVGPAAAGYGGGDDGLPAAPTRMSGWQDAVAGPAVMAAPAAFPPAGEPVASSGGGYREARGGPAGADKPPCETYGSGVVIEVRPLWREQGRRRFREMADLLRRSTGPLRWGGGLHGAASTGVLAVPQFQAAG